MPTLTEPAPAKITGADTISLFQLGILFVIRVSYWSCKAGNEADVGVKVKAVGEVCNACHKEFRAEKYSE